MASEREMEEEYWRQGELEALQKALRERERLDPDAPKDIVMPKIMAEQTATDIKTRDWIETQAQLPPEDGYYLGSYVEFGGTVHELNYFKGKWYLPTDEMIEMGIPRAWRRKPTPFIEIEPQELGGNQ